MGAIVFKMLNLSDFLIDMDKNTQVILKVLNHNKGKIKNKVFNIGQYHLCASKLGTRL